MKTRLRFTTISLLALGTLFLIFLGCNTDSPTEPGQTVIEGTGTSGGWAITIEASSNTMAAGGESIDFTVTITNRESGGAPPDGAVAVVSTNLGELHQETSGVETDVLTLFGGQAAFEVFSTDEEGTATVVVAFQNSTARRNVMVTDEIFLFLESISPDSSGKFGGAVAVIEGQGFDEPMRVDFGGVQAEVLSVTANKVRVRVPESANAENLFQDDFEIVDVTVTLFEADGSGGAATTATDTLPNAFTYRGSGQPDAPPNCGDDTTDPDEECDDGNSILGDGCRNDCTLEVCGDGITDPGEECDDNNLLSGDGCSSTCTSEILPTCGDGNTDPGEECDDGNVFLGDGCRNDCTLELCGDGMLDPQEECDDNNLVDGDGCDSSCVAEVAPVCGDGNTDPGEACDDGNLILGDGCRNDCTAEVCGDGTKDPQEECDDNNLVNGDGCDDSCLIEPAPFCGDGNTDPGEQCDDADFNDRDGCLTTCVLASCGDGEVHDEEGGLEQCDDGNVINGDGCSATCQNVP